MSKILVTGVNGFVGVHLTSALTAAGHKVIGAGLTESVESEQAKNLESYYQCDITNTGEVARLPLSSLDGIISLAGLAALGPSFDNPDKYMRINTAVVSVLCDELIKQNLQSRVRMVAISSGTVYDNSQPMPLDEDSKTTPSSSPYSASKLAMEKLALDYVEQGLQCVIARPFNHIGPGQGPGFLLPDLYANLSEALVSGKPLRVGNLTTKRDFTDVRDVVQAYVRLATSTNLPHQIYNVCSGVARSGEDVLRVLVAKLGSPTDIIVDDNLFRPSDAPVFFGDNKRITADTNWQPSIEFQQTIADYIASKS